MARDPDSLETAATGTESARHSRSPMDEFVTGPSRAEHSIPRSATSQPLWPWLLIMAAVVAAGLIYVLVQ